MATDNIELIYIEKMPSRWARYFALLFWFGSIFSGFWWCYAYAGGSWFLQLILTACAFVGLVTIARRQSGKEKHMNEQEALAFLQARAKPQ